MESELFQQLEAIDQSISYNDYELQKKTIISMRTDYNLYISNENLYDIIEKDVQRIMPDVPFFHEKADFTIPFRFYTSTYQHRKKLNTTSTKHFDVLGRILYLYGHFNPVIKYMQGMNDLVAMLYYNIRSEAHTFFCFTILMSYHKDLFIRELDYQPEGIRGLLFKLDRMFHEKMPSLFKHLSSIGLHPQMYGYRWIITAMTHEFTFDQVQIIWDTMLATKDYHEFLIKYSISILKYLEPQLKDADFPTAITILLKSQKDIDCILSIYNDI